MVVNGHDDGLVQVHTHATHGHAHGSILSEGDSDSFELLRRLSRATSSSPAPKETPNLQQPESRTETGLNHNAEGTDGSRPRLMRDERRPRDLGAKGSRDRLTVGFVSGRSRIRLMRMSWSLI